MAVDTNEDDEKLVTDHTTRMMKIVPFFFLRNNFIDEGNFSHHSGENFPQWIKNVILLILVEIIDFEGRMKLNEFIEWLGFIRFADLQNREDH